MLPLVPLSAPFADDVFMKETLREWPCGIAATAFEARPYVAQEFQVPHL